MNLNIIWAIGGAVAIVFFSVVEWFAIDHPTSQWTLSHGIAWLGVHFPLSIWIFGVFTGGLAVHFFWHYCPPSGGP
jgi:hypothetical protein